MRLFSPDAAPLIINTPHQSSTFITMMKLQRQILITWSLGLVHSVGLAQCLTTCIPHYSIPWSILTTPKIPCAPPLQPSAPATLKTTDLSTVSIVICHIVGISVCRLYKWFNSLSDIHLRFPMSFCGLIGHFFSSTELTVHCLAISQFVHPLI